MKRVFVLSQQSLFGKGIETLLLEESGIKVIQWGESKTPIYECVRAANPDIVIIDCDDMELDLSSVIRCILREKPTPGIIGLSLEHNEISVYRGEQKEILQMTDLLDIIRC